MKIGVPTEIKAQENRVGAVPAMVMELAGDGHEVLVEQGAGLGAGIRDEDFAAVGAKLVPDAPHEVLLVLDATAGQNGISQAKGFSDAVECTGIVLAKLDGTAKGGVVIPIRQQFELPVKYVGVGEKAEDLAVFDSDHFVQALLADTHAPPS